MTESYADQLEGKIRAEWLPAWKKIKQVDGSLRSTPNIPEPIARSVIKAMERKVVTASDHGSFRLPGGSGGAGIFWHGDRTASPRRVYFAFEGLLSVAMAYDLVERGWNPSQMDFEVLASAFDVGVYDRRSNRMLIIGEAKTHDRDVEKLVRRIDACGRLGPHEKATCIGNTTGHAKYAGIVAARPQLLWVVSPGVKRVFSPVFLAPGQVGLIEVDDVWLTRPKKGKGHIDV